jgi:hypothetical protein
VWCIMSIARRTGVEMCSWGIDCMVVARVVLKRSRGRGVVSYGGRSGIEDSISF